MSHEIYKVLHILGILMLFSGLTALWGVCLKGVPTKSLRISLALIHGVGMTLLLVSGMAMAGKLGVFTSGTTGWIWTKLAIWLALGGSMVLAKRKAQLGTGLLVLWIGLGTLAAYLAIFKPF